MRRFISSLGRAIAMTFAAIALAWLPDFAGAADMATGIAWLQAQVNADGSLGGESAAQATPLQTRAEALSTFKLLSSVPSALAAALAAASDDNTEYLARRAIALNLAGQNTDALIAALSARQNADGGFGGAVESASNPLDTALAVLSLVGKLASQDSRRIAAGSFILSTLDADGGVAGGTDTQRIALSALVLRALQTSIDPAASTAATRLSSWLLQRQQIDGSWLEDSLLTALVMEAVSPLVSDTAAKGAAGGFLLAKQAADGSWDKDPYLTAVVLRALAAIQTSGTGNGTGASLSGTVADASGQALAAGISLTRSGTSTTAATDGNGHFILANLVAGTYLATFSAPGYLPASRTVAVAAGQNLDVGTITLSRDQQTAVISGSITDGVSGNPLPGAAVTVSSGGQATTDAAGTYAISGIAPGTISVTARRAGYQTASGNATLTAGEIATFSPALYPTGVTVPGAGSYRASVIDSDTRLPLAGVLLQSSGQTLATSGADGALNVSLGVGSYTVVVQLTGYRAVTQTFIVTGGATIEAGTIALSKQRSSSTLRGRVLDVAGSAIAGAQVQIVGGTSVQSGADGAYRIDGLAGTQWNVRVSATGYASQAYAIQVPQPSDIVQDVHLAAVQANGVGLAPLRISPDTAPANTDVTASTTLTNTGTADFSGSLLLLVADGAGKAIGNGALYDAHGVPLGMVTVAAGQSVDLVGKWNTGSFAPGAYTLTLRVVAPGSINRDNPLGTLLIDAQGAFDITGSVHFTGTVSATPPVIRAGLNQAVSLAAMLQNDGNIALPAQRYTLTAIDTKTNAAVHSATAQGGATPAAGLLPLDFGSWVPAAAGDYRLEVTAGDPSLGQAAGKAYVGDAATASFTVDKTAVPSGTSLLKGHISISGQDVSQGTISDPLAPLIRTAVQKSVSYNDAQAWAWTLLHGCQGCHIQVQAMVGGETNRALTTFNAYDRAAIINNTTFNQMVTGELADGYTPSYHRTLTMLGLWAVTAYHNLSDLSATLKKAADWIVAQQDASGAWFGDYNDSWYDSPISFTALGIKNLIASQKHLAGLSGSPVLYYKTEPYLPAFTHTSRWLFLAAANGDLYFSDNSSQVTHLGPDGTVIETWVGFNDAKGLLESRTGGILLATGGGLYRLDSGGLKTQLNSINIDSLVYGPDGKLYAPSWGGAIYQMDETGAASVWLSGAPLSNPAGVVFDAQGGMLVVNYADRNILRFAPDKSYQIVLLFAQGTGRPLQLIPDGDGWLLSATNGLYRFNSEWVAERRLYEPLWHVQRLPDGSLIGVVENFPGFKKIVPYAADVATSLANYAGSIDTATTYLMGQTVSSGDNLHQAFQLIGLGEAAQFYRSRDPARAASLVSKMTAIATALRSNQNSDGGWGRAAGNASDPLITAQVGYAIDYTSPSAGDPALRRATAWLLSKQQGDGSWHSSIAATNLSATTWVSIWLPIMLDRLGSIDTDLTLSFPANTQITNPNPLPDSTQTDALGQTTALWKLTGVTSQGRDITFDLTLADMQPGENRPVATDAHLTFNNTFTQLPVIAPIDIPTVAASSYLALDVATDKPQYGADEPVAVAARVTNGGATADAGAVELAIYAADGTLVLDLGTQTFAALAPGAQLPATAAWNTGHYAAGLYAAVGTVYDAQARAVGEATAFFSIGSGASAQVGANIASDKRNYLPSDSVKLTDRIGNLSPNRTLSDLTLITTVYRPDGSTHWTQRATLAQFQGGTSRAYNYGVNLALGAAGSYRAVLTLVDSTGTELAAAETGFTVGSTLTNGSGLSGTLAATPRSVLPGKPVTLSATVSNLGNADLSALPLTLSIIDPSSETVLASWPYHADIARQKDYSATATWATRGSGNTTYVAVLSATVGGRNLTLASDSFTLIAAAPPQPVPALATQSAALLALVLLALGIAHRARPQHP